jgi:hypothetical protein
VWASRFPVVVFVTINGEHYWRIGPLVADEEISWMASEQDNAQQASSDQTTASRWKRWRGLSVQAQFEHVIVLFLSALIAAVVALTHVGQ